MSTDAEHINWIINRLTKVHGDHEQSDFVQRLREIAKGLGNSPAAAATRGRYPRGQNGQHDRMLATQFLDAIVDERHRAHDKHGATSMEQAPLLAHKRASVLTEEAVECAKALNDHEHGEIHLYGGTLETVPAGGCDQLDKELIQTAAMAYTWWANRRGDRLDPPEQKPIRAGNAPTLPVIFNGVPYTGVVDPATGTVHVHSVDRLVVEVQSPPIPPVPVRKGSDLSFHEVSFIRGPSEPPADDPDGGRRGD